MLNSENNFALCATKKIYIRKINVRKKNSERNKNHNPSPLQVKWSVPKQCWSRGGFLCF